MHFSSNALKQVRKNNLCCAELLGSTWCGLNPPLTHSFHIMVPWNLYVYTPAQSTHHDTASQSQAKAPFRPKDMNGFDANAGSCVKASRGQRLGCRGKSCAELIKFEQWWPISSANSVPKEDRKVTTSKTVVDFLLIYKNFIFCIDCIFHKSYNHNLWGAFCLEKPVR